MALSECQWWFCDPGTACRSIIEKMPLAAQAAMARSRWAEPLFLHYERVGIVFQVPVVERDPDRVDPDGGKESSVVVAEEV